MSFKRWGGLEWVHFLLLCWYWLNWSFLGSGSYRPLLLRFDWKSKVCCCGEQLGGLEDTKMSFQCYFDTILEYYKIVSHTAESFHAQVEDEMARCPKLNNRLLNQILSFAKAAPSACSTILPSLWYQHSPASHLFHWISWATLSHHGKASHLQLDRSAQYGENTQGVHIFQWGHRSLQWLYTIPYLIFLKL